MTIIFDGREFANKKEVELKGKVTELKNKSIIPKLVSILVGEDPASSLYVSLKKRAAERIGAEAIILKLKDNEKVEESIQKFNNDTSVHGLMVQLPIPGLDRSEAQNILNKIAAMKDVDGLREDSIFIHPTTKAVLEIIHEAGVENGSVVVVGATGMIGRTLVKELKSRGYKVIECNTKTSDLKYETLKADILVSVTGREKIIKGDMVKDGAVVVDVGSPKGDVEFDEVSKKTSFITPVPGGVGPVTISCLLENLVKAAIRDK